MLRSSVCLTESDILCFIHLPLCAVPQIHAHYELKKASRHRRNLAITGGVALSIITAPVIAAVSVGETRVPLLHHERLNPVHTGNASQTQSNRCDPACVASQVSVCPSCWPTCTAWCPSLCVGEEAVVSAEGRDEVYALTSMKTTVPSQVRTLNTSYV